jgi:hypothetical protein
MSKIALTPNASGSGTLTIAAPNTSTDRTLTLPDETGDVVVTDGTTLFVDNTNNRVGIGTSSPSNKLKIYDSAATSTTFKANTLLNVSSNGSGADATINLTDGVANNAVISQLSGQLLFGTGSGAPERMRIDSSGNVNVGRTVATTSNTVGCSLLPDGSIIIERDNNQLMSLNRLNGNGTLILFARGAGNNVGSIVGNTSSVSYNTSSDYRLKENVVEVTDGINRVKLLKPSRFNFIADPDKTVDGFLAHEVSDVVPEAIHGTKDQVDKEGDPIYQGIDQSKLVPLLTAALQEAITKIESLEARVASLESA